jgi:hypothetical protein
MSTVNKCGFFRPVEIRTGVNDTIEFAASGGANSPYSISINAGTYSSMMAVCEAFTTACLADTDMFTTDGITTTISIKYANTAHDIGDSDSLTYYDVYSFFEFSGENCSIDFQNSTTYLMFGFAAQTSAEAATHTSTNPIEYKWMPVFQNTKQAIFKKDMAAAFGGIRTKTGGLSGGATGSNVHFLECGFFNEPANNMTESCISGSEFLYHTAEYFFVECRTAAPAVSGNPIMNGFFYYRNMNDVIDGSSRINVIPGGTTGIDWSREGVRYQYDSSPDLYTWCALDPKGYNDPVPTAQRGITWWQFEFVINRDTNLPTFKAPDQT